MITADHILESVRAKRGEPAHIHYIIGYLRDNYPRLYEKYKRSRRGRSNIRRLIRDWADKHHELFIDHFRQAHKDYVIEHDIDQSHALVERRVDRNTLTWIGPLEDDAPVNRERIRRIMMLMVVEEPINA